MIGQGIDVINKLREQRLSENSKLPFFKNTTVCISSFYKTMVQQGFTDAFGLCGKGEKIDLHGETRNEVYLVDPVRRSEKPADVNVISRSAKNTKDGYWTIKEQSGANGKDWEFFYRKDWKWFNQLDAIYSADLRRVASARPHNFLETGQRLGAF